MAVAFRFPDVGEGITEGEVVRWLVAQGDAVRADQPLVEVETDKAVVEIPAPCAGTILRLPVAVGEKIHVGDVLVVIGAVGETLPDSAPVSAPEREPAAVSVVGRLDADVTELPPPVPEHEAADAMLPKRILAIPSVRRLARERGVDLRHVTPTGPRGRIRREDVLQATSQTMPPAVAEPMPALDTARDAYGAVTYQSLTPLRRTIAKAMVKAATTAVPVTTTDEADVTELVAWRERSKATYADVHITLLPFIMKAVVTALRQHPLLNASLDEVQERLTLKHYYHLGIATDTPEGLIVPVIKDVEQKNIVVLATELQELTRQARNRRVALADLRGGTFTISNYGAIGGIFATPMLLLPQVAILGVGKLLQKPMLHAGDIAVRTVLPLSLTFDHRVLDGATAQRFLNTAMTYLSDPVQLFVKL